MSSYRLPSRIRNQIGRRAARAIEDEVNSSRQQSSNGENQGPGQARQDTGEAASTAALRKHARSFIHGWREIGSTLERWMKW